MSEPSRYFFECQDCGKRLRDMLPRETREVALDPYRFILYCDECAYDHNYIDYDHNYVETLASWGLEADDENSN